MTEEFFEKAQNAICGVKNAEFNLEKLSHYSPDRLCAIKIGSTDCGGASVYLEREVADQVINLVTDYYEKKKSECQKQFDAL